MRSRAAAWYPDLRAGLEATIFGLPTCIGPILIFVGFFGPLSLPAALWATLMTATLVPAAGLLLKGHPAVLLSSRAASLTVYAALILQLSLAAADPGTHAMLPTAAQFVTGVAAASLLFALASLAVMLAGLFGLGNVFKMIPNTVTAGINNSTAVLLMWLAIKQLMGSHSWSLVVAAGVWLGFRVWQTLQKRFDAAQLVPDVLMAVLLGLGLHWLDHFETVTNVHAPVSYGWTWVNAGLWPDLWQQPQLVRLLIAGLPGAVTLALVMILESFTANSTMESRFGLRIHANRELIALGGCNLVSAVFGGVPATGVPLRSMVSWAAGGGSVRAALAGMVLTGLTLVVLGQWLLLMPAGLLAGIFLIQAFLIVDPVFKARLIEMLRTRRVRRNGAADLGFWITAVITLAGIFGNLIWACFLGIGLSSMAVLRSLSGSLTSHWAYLDKYRSRRVRSLDEITSLEQAFAQLGILQLTGHLFFGNSSRLTQLADELHPDAQVVVIDVSQVVDVDPSGLAALNWLMRALEDRQLVLILSGEKATRSEDLRQALQARPDMTRCIDLDRALEAGEEQVLQKSATMPAKLSCVLAKHNLLLCGISGDALHAVLAQCEPRQLQAGEVLFRQQSCADGVWLLEQGQVSILSGDDDATRLATFGPGQFVGEMGFVDGKPRSATARADSALRAVFLANRSLASLSAQGSGAALAIIQNIARELSHRMRNTSAHAQIANQMEPGGWANSELLSTFTRN